MAVAGAACLFGCLQMPREDAPAGVAPRVTDVSAPPRLDPRLQARAWTFDALPGWAAGDHAGAVEALAANCVEVTPSDPRDDGAAPERDWAWLSACRRVLTAVAHEDWSPNTSRDLLEEVFTPALLSGPLGDLGLVTAYYEPIIEVRRTPTEEFREPILGLPPDLVLIEYDPPRDGVREEVFRRTPSGDLTAYPERAVIRDGRTEAEVLAWGRVSDVVFLQIQGSGRLAFDDGEQVRAAFAGTNGLGYVSIARTLIDREVFPEHGASNQAVKAWLEGGDPATVDAVVDENPRYVFFKLESLGDPSLGPPGDAGFALRPKVSVAVDLDWHSYGALYWIAPEGPGAPAAQFGMAHDRGAAIRGPLRADLFFGTGPVVGLRASRVRHEAEWWVLLPATALADAEP